MKLTKKQSPPGFFTFEAILSLAMLATVTVLYTHGSQRFALREKAQQVKADLATLDAALQATAKTAAAPLGVPVDLRTLRSHIPAKHPLLTSDKDPFGNTYTGLVLGQKPSVPAVTAEQMVEIVGPGFWEPYPVSQRK